MHTSLDKIMDLYKISIDNELLSKSIYDKQFIEPASFESFPIHFFVTTKEFIDAFKKSIKSDEIIEKYLLSVEVYENFKNCGANLSDFTFSIYGSRIQFMFEQSIKFILDHLGYEVKYIDNENMYKVLLKNTSVDQIATNTDDTEMAWQLYEYDSISATLENKRRILMDLYKKYEKIRPDIKDNAILKTVSNVEELIECVRHTDDTHKTIAYPFYYENEGKWCDIIFAGCSSALFSTKISDQEKNLVS